MTALARWLRGALGIGVVSTTLWLAIGIMLWAAMRLFRPEDIGQDGLRVVLPILGLVGFLSGLGFAALITLAERRRPLRELSPGRIALWGFLGAGGIPVLLGADAGEGWITGVLGATFATLSVAMARRRWPDRDVTPLPRR